MNYTVIFHRDISFLSFFRQILKFSLRRVLQVSNVRVTVAVMSTRPLSSACGLAEKSVEHSVHVRFLFDLNSTTWVSCITYKSYYFLWNWDFKPKELDTQCFENLTFSIQVSENSIAHLVYKYNMFVIFLVVPTFLDISLFPIISIDTFSDFKFNFTYKYVSIIWIFFNNFSF